MPRSRSTRPPGPGPTETRTRWAVPVLGLLLIVPACVAGSPTRPTVAQPTVAQPTTSRSPSTTSAASSTTAGTPLLPALELSWERVPVVETTRPAAAALLAGDGDRPFWVVGSSIDEGFGQATPLVWSAGDDGGWDRVVLDPSVGSAVPQAVARRGSDVVIVGADASSDELDARPGGIAWQRRDGGAWRRLGLAPDQPMAGVRGGGLGYLAWTDERVWFSTSGEEWEELPDVPVPTDGRAAVSASAMVVVTDDGIVRTGNGRGWQEIGPPPGPEGAEDTRLTAVSAAEEGFLAMGVASVPDPDQEGALRPAPVVWTSETGATWSLVETTGFPTTPDGAPSPEATLLTAGPERIVAILSLGESNVWTSAGGAAWEPLRRGPFSGSELVDVAVDGDGTVLVASETTVWRLGLEWDALPGLAEDAVPAPAPVLGIAAAAGRLTMVTGLGSGGPEPSGSAVWTSDDAATWEQGPDTALATARIGGVAGLGGAFAAVGGSLPTGLEPPRVWISPDGAGWEPIEDPALDEAPAAELATLLAAGTSRVAAGTVVGEDGETDLGVWTSTGTEPWQAHPGNTLDWALAGAQRVTGGCSAGSTVVLTGADRPAMEGESGAGTAGEGPDRGVFWTSTDGGETFSRVDEPVVSWVAGCVAIQEGFLAAGWAPVEDPEPNLVLTSMTSEDGLTWSDHRVVADDLDLRGTALLIARSSAYPRVGLAAGDGWVAATTESSPLTGRTDLGLWLSEDGRDWRRVRQPPSVFGGFGVQSAIQPVTWERRLVVAGNSGSAPVVWIGTP